MPGLWAAGAPLGLLLSPARASALDLKILTSEQGARLMSVARTIAPHDGLPDTAYAPVIRAIDDAAAADAHVHAVVSAGLDRLGEDFASHTQAQRVRSLSAMESSEFFRLARAKTLAVLYASPAAYAHFGYQGEAFSKGGYLSRGFNDLKWLPDVPLQDSGPVFSQEA